MINLWVFACAFLCALCVGALVCWLYPVASDDRVGGVRATKRKEAIGSGWLVASGVAIVVHLAGKLGRVQTSAVVKKMDVRMHLTGNPWGFDGGEFLVASTLCALLGTLAGAVLSAAGGIGTVPGMLVGGFTGGVFLLFRAGDVQHRRLVHIRRDLPSAIDLLALSMQAGLDFAGALRLLVNEMNEKNPLQQELAGVLDRLVLGMSRNDALREFAACVPIVSVREFVGSVIQASRQGTPLNEVLAVQAQTMRTVRSQNAEQAASRAAILLLGPLMLIFISVFLLLLGPFAIKAARGELF